MISAEDELARVLPLVKLIHEKFPSTTLSIDTFYSQVAEACLHAGARIINDISAGNMDKQMLPLVAKYQAPYICMHMQGTPKTMQHDPVYNDVVGSVYTFFANKLEQFHQFGIKDVILDVGFGFGKTITHNYQLLQQLNTFSSLGKPLLVGVSRKSMVYKPLNSTSEEALNGTSALHMIALERGAKILRVHDVKEAKEIVTLHKMLHAS
jgi:dihydropteroate synthase